MSKTIACVVARTVSTRLPLKVIRSVYNNFSMLDFIIERLKLLKKVDDIFICTSNDPVDEILEDTAFKNNVKIYRGAKDEVITRLIDVGEAEDADYLIRITGDNVFNAYEFMDRMIDIHVSNELDYSRLSGLPFGSTPEILSLEGLKDCYNRFDPSLSEYLTLFMFMPEYYKCGVISSLLSSDMSRYRLTVDTKEDLIRTRMIIEKAETDKLKLTTSEIISVIENFKIPYSCNDLDAKIKLPNNEIVSFGEFARDLRGRADKSQMYQL